MRKVRQKDTGPEVSIRKLLFRLGYRYRVNVKNLPGKPDIAFTKRKKVIFVHGCFWHGHGCQKGRLPKSRLDYWKPKIRANRQRDKANLQALKELGWDTLVVWQCELSELDAVKQHLLNFLGPPKANSRT